MTMENNPTVEITFMSKEQEEMKNEVEFTPISWPPLPLQLQYLSLTLFAIDDNPDEIKVSLSHFVWPIVLNSRAWNRDEVA